MGVTRLGPLIADLRGKVGDIIFSRNQGGCIARGVSSKTWTPSPLRTSMQVTIADIAHRWSSQLTQSQRDGWYQYANMYPLEDRWGHPTIKNGYAWYIRINFLWGMYRNTQEFQDPPLQPPLAKPRFDIEVTNTASTTGLYLPCLGMPQNSNSVTSFVEVSGPCNIGEMKNNGRWFRAGIYDTRSTGEPIFYNFLTYPTLTSGRKYFARLVIQDSTDGAISRKGQTQCLST